MHCTKIIGIDYMQYAIVLHDSIADCMLHAECIGSEPCL